MPEEAHLLEVASAIVDLADVDWNEVDRNCKSDRERSIAKELQVLGHIARAVRDISDAPGAGEKPAPALHAVPDLERWGHLTLRAEIGRGSFGVVYRAWDPKLQSEVALKLVKRPALTSVLAGTGALDEARLLARVRHENVVPVYGADYHDERFGVWMKLVRGRTLEQVLEVQGAMGAREAALVGLDLCHALAAVHGAGLVHRDLKAANVMREEGGRILLMDFGAGQRLPTIDDPVTGLVGTPLYLAPELFRGKNPSAASDIYSLGVLLYFLLTGSYPVQERSREAIQRAHAEGKRRFLRDARPDLPAPLIDVIERALSPEPADRHRTAGEFGNALAAVAGLRAVREERPRPPVRRVPWKALAAAAAAAVIIVLAVVQMGRGTDGPTAPGTLPRSDAGENASSAPPPPGSYTVEAAFYAHRNAERVRLAEGSRISPGDGISFAITISRPLYVYVINQDDRGVAHVQFPLPGHRLTNPVSAGTHRLPGLREDTEVVWEVTTAGGREHFMLYASPERLGDLEQLWASVPRPEFGRPVEGPQQLAVGAIGVMRSVGGLKESGPAERTSPPGLVGLKPLLQVRETVQGLWAREITFDNPQK
jgi:serine/threonine-protein kinase